MSANKITLCRLFCQATLNLVWLAIWERRRRKNRNMVALLKVNNRVVLRIKGNSILF